MGGGRQVSDGDNSQLQLIDIRVYSGPDGIWITSVPPITEDLQRLFEKTPPSVELVGYLRQFMSRLSHTSHSGPLLEPGKKSCLVSLTTLYTDVIPMPTNPYSCVSLVDAFPPGNMFGRDKSIRYPLAVTRYVNTMTQSSSITHLKRRPSNTTSICSTTVSAPTQTRASLL